MGIYASSVSKSGRLWSKAHHTFRWRIDKWWSQTTGASHCFWLLLAVNGEGRYLSWENFYFLKLISRKIDCDDLWPACKFSGIRDPKTRFPLKSVWCVWVLRRQTESLWKCWWIMQFSRRKYKTWSFRCTLCFQQGCNTRW